MNILGTEYTVIHDIDALDAVDADGLCDRYAKTINLRCLPEMLDGQDVNAKARRFDEVFRHEIIHAFLHESGMSKYEEDEEVVDWIARLYPKMAVIFGNESLDE
ncbi:MAG: hypothetical protein LUD72_11270 [Bacteroidales bacterium]|nr:hypothetical protein [Bacteroidales bacterium]